MAAAPDAPASSGRCPQEADGTAAAATDERLGDLVRKVSRNFKYEILLPLTIKLKHKKTQQWNYEHIFLYTNKHIWIRS